MVKEYSRFDRVNLDVSDVRSRVTGRRNGARRARRDDTGTAVDEAAPRRFLLLMEGDAVTGARGEPTGENTVSIHVGSGLGVARHTERRRGVAVMLRNESQHVDLVRNVIGSRAPPARGGVRSGISSR